MKRMFQLLMHDMQNDKDLIGFLLLHKVQHSMLLFAARHNSDTVLSHVVLFADANLAFKIVSII